MRLFAPLMPFMTEELYQRLPHPAGEKAESICIAPYPQELGAVESADEMKQMETLQTVGREVRSVLGNLNIASNIRVKLFFSTKGEGARKLISEEENTLKVLGRGEQVTLLDEGAEEPKGCVKKLIGEDIVVYVQMAGLIDPQQEVRLLIE